MIWIFSEDLDMQFELVFAIIIWISDHDLDLWSIFELIRNPDLSIECKVKTWEWKSITSKMRKVIEIVDMELWNYDAKFGFILEKRILVRRRLGSNKAKYLWTEEKLIMITTIDSIALAR